MFCYRRRYVSCRYTSALVFRHQWTTYPRAVSPVYVLILRLCAWLCATCSRPVIPRSPSARLIPSSSTAIHWPPSRQQCPLFGASERPGRYPIPEASKPTIYSDGLICATLVRRCANLCTRFEETILLYTR